MKIRLFNEIPTSVIFLCIIFIISPIFFDNYEMYLFDDMVWFLLLFPCIMFSYHLGFNGGLFAAIIVNVYHLLWFLIERFMQSDEIANEELALHTGVAIVTFFCSIGVGFLSEKLKEKQKQLQKMNEKLKQMALHDSLTNLPNRHYFMEELTKLIEEKESLSLLFIDLDGFKLVNDQYGHEKGDHLLKEIAQKLLFFWDDHTFISRLGGDEFVVSIKGAEEEKSINIARDILTTLQIKVGDVSISASIGIAFSTNEDSSTTLLKKADEAMYQAKSAGKCTIVLYQQ